LLDVNLLVKIANYSMILEIVIPRIILLCELTKRDLPTSKDSCS